MGMKAQALEYQVTVTATEWKQKPYGMTVQMKWRLKNPPALVAKMDWENSRYIRQVDLKAGNKIVDTGAENGLVR